MSKTLWKKHENLCPEQLKAALDAGESVALLDAREAGERAEVRLADTHHIPLGQLPGRLKELDPKTELVVYCRSGNRSGMAAVALRIGGFANVHNLSGGITGWIEKFDTSLVRG